jgi:hypothetical protein
MPLPQKRLLSPVSPDHAVSRLVDEHILPDMLYERREGRRCLKLSCAFAGFSSRPIGSHAGAAPGRDSQSMGKVFRRADQERLFQFNGIGLFANPGNDSRLRTRFACTVATGYRENEVRAGARFEIFDICLLAGNRRHCWFG